jgi:hypothetical protein
MLSDALPVEWPVLSDLLERERVATWEEEDSFNVTPLGDSSYRALLPILVLWRRLYIFSPHD